MNPKDLDIKFLERNPCEVKCLACDSHKGYYYVSARHFAYHERVSTYSKCSKCSSLNLIGGHEDCYKSTLVDEEKRKIYLKYYLEICAGIEQMAEELSSIHVPTGAVVADVGGGIGLASDFINRTFDKVTSICFEPNLYGKVPGLNATIIKLPLDSEWLDNNDMRFDVIYSSEVIEHIGDPIDFLLTLKRALRNENGVFVMTTPDADSINQESAENMLYSRLFPGEHKCIYSREGIRNLFERAGFSTPIFSTRSDTIAFSASTGLSSDSGISQANPDLYPIYLQSVVTESGFNGGNPYYDGCTFRLFKYYVNKGDLGSADNLLEKSFVLRGLLEKDCRSIARTVLTDALEAVSLDEYVSKVPAFLGPFCFYYSMYSILKYGENAVSGRNLKIALDVLEHEFYVSSTHFIEASSLISPCLRQLSLTEAVQGFSSSSHDYWMQSLNYHGDVDQVSDELSCILRLIVRHVNNRSYDIVGDMLAILRSERYDGVGNLFPRLEDMNIFEIPRSDRRIQGDFYASLIHYSLDASDGLECRDDFLRLSVAAVSDMLLAYPDDVSFDYLMPALARGGRFLAAQTTT